MIGTSAIAEDKENNQGATEAGIKVTAVSVGDPMGWCHPMKVEKIFGRGRVEQGLPPFEVDGDWPWNEAFFPKPSAITSQDGQ